MDEDLFRALEQLEPHGLGNPSPTFLVRNARIKIRRVFGKSQEHLDLDVSGVPAIWWRGVNNGFGAGDTFKSDVVVEVEWDDYRGKTRLNVKAMPEEGVAAPVC